MQATLFYDDVLSALKHCVQTLGGSKKVGSQLRPELSVDVAGRWLSDCLNESRKEKLDIEQILFILRESRRIGCHDAMNFIARDTGYADPTPIEPEDQYAELQRQFMLSVQLQSEIAARMERLNRRRPAVKD